MDTFTPGYVGNISLIYTVPGRAANLTLQVVRLSDETTYYGPSGTGIEEDESGVYDIDEWAYPSLGGSYRASWYDDGVLIPGAVDEWQISPVATAVGAAPPSNAERYVTLDEIKASASLTGQTYADADILLALDAASRGLEDAYETLWLAPASDIRYYTRSGTRSVHLGDVQSISEVALDYSYSDVYSDGRVWDWDTGLGTYGTILDPTWYRLLPIQAGAVGDGEPYQTLQLTRASQRLILPSGQDAIRITGSFGWVGVPSGVRTAVKMIAERLTRRTREAPFGIIAIGAEGAVIRARDIARDPDISFVMRPVSGTQSLFV